MKTLIIWSLLFIALIGTIGYLLSQRAGVFNAAPTDTTNGVIDTNTTVRSFDQAIVYTCAGGAKIATAFETGTTDRLELSVPNSSPILLASTESASGVKYTNETGIVFWEKSGSASVEKNGEIQYKECVVALPSETESVAPTSTPFMFAGTSWQWTITNSSDGTILSKPNKSDDFILKFQDEGKFSVSTDCNNAGGSYSTDNKGVVTFNEMVMTLMACAGETKEADFLSSLAQVQSFGFAMTEADLELRLGEGFPQTYMNFTRID